jgi:hypothetical protein
MRPTVAFRFVGRPLSVAKGGRAELFDQEPVNGRAIFVRFVVSNITPDSCRFEQLFSDDGGKTWEVNWIAIDTRMKAELVKAHGTPPQIMRFLPSFRSICLNGIDHAPAASDPISDFGFL